MGQVDGKRIVVTGASRGLGRAFAAALAGEGARLVLNGTNAALVEGLVSQIRDAGGTASAGGRAPTPDRIAARPGGPPPAGVRWVGRSPHQPPAGRVPAP